MTTKASLSFTKKHSAFSLISLTGPHSSHTNQQWSLNSIRVKGIRSLRSIVTSFQVNSFHLTVTSFQKIATLFHKQIVGNYNVVMLCCAIQITNTTWGVANGKILDLPRRHWDPCLKIWAGDSVRRKPSPRLHFAKIRAGFENCSSYNW